MKILSAAVIIVLLLIIGVLVLGQMGYIDLPDAFRFSPGESSDGDKLTKEQPVGTAKSGYSDTDIFYMLQQIAGKPLNYGEAVGYIEALHMQAYGVDGRSYAQVILEYQNKYASYTYIGQTTMTGSGWTAVLAGWTHDISEGAGVLAGSGAAVSAAYHHDTMVLLSNGPIAVHQQFVIWITT